MRRNKPADPTAERTAQESTQSASGLTGGKPSGSGERERNTGDEEIGARRRAAAKAAPRRYEIDEDPVMPEDDATLKTKI